MSTNPAAAAANHELEHDIHTHPGWKTYVVIGAILTVITAVEVAIFYIPAMRPVLTPILLTLSAAKFIIVVMFYMHLKFDSRLFSTVFIAPLILAVGVVIALVILFKVVPLYYPQ
jgi:cytochrome c oxidase subunit 4